MAPGDVFKLFELYFPQYSGKSFAAWFPNGRNSIRVRQTDGREFVFTYGGKDDWKFETVKSFLKTLKGEKK